MLAKIILLDEEARGTGQLAGCVALNQFHLEVPNIIGNLYR